MFNCLDIYIYVFQYCNIYVLTGRRYAHSLGVRGSRQRLERAPRAPRLAKPKNTKNLAWYQNSKFMVKCLEKMKSEKIVNYCKCSKCCLLSFHLISSSPSYYKLSLLCLYPLSEFLQTLTLTIF